MNLLTFKSLTVLKAGYFILALCFANDPLFVFLQESQTTKYVQFSYVVVADNGCLYFFFEVVVKCTPD